MKINDQWSIRQSKGQFVVVETRNGRNPKTGEATENESHTYHPTLGQCAKKIARSETLSALDEGDLWSAVSAVEAATNRLIESFESARSA